MVIWGETAPVDTFGHVSRLFNRRAMERRECSVQSAENGRGGGVLTCPGRFAGNFAHVDSVHTQSAAAERQEDVQLTED